MKRSRYPFNTLKKKIFHKNRMHIYLLLLYFGYIVSLGSLLPIFGLLVMMMAFPLLEIIVYIWLIEISLIFIIQLCLRYLVLRSQLKMSAFTSICFLILYLIIMGVIGSFWYVWMIIFSLFCDLVLLILWERKR